jgi:hypothetical protein
MALIEKPEDWWELWELRRGEIMMIAEKVGITVETVQNNDTTSLGFKLNEATVDRRHDPIIQFLNYVWETAPDSPEIHSWEGWADLCDLCSENWVFDPKSYEDVSKGGEYQ